MSRDSNSNGNEGQNTGGCHWCVIQQVEAWSGQSPVSGSDVLGELYEASGGVCDNGALHALAAMIEENCEREADVNQMSCSMTVSNLQSLVCGF